MQPQTEAGKKSHKRRNMVIIGVVVAVAAAFVIGILAAQYGLVPGLSPIGVNPQVCAAASDPSCKGLTGYASGGSVALSVSVTSLPPPFGQVTLEIKNMGASTANITEFVITGQAANKEFKGTQLAFVHNPFSLTFSDVGTYNCTPTVVVGYTTGFYVAGNGGVCSALVGLSANLYPGDSISVEVISNTGASATTRYTVPAS